MLIEEKEKHVLQITEERSSSEREMQELRSESIKKQVTLHEIRNLIKIQAEEYQNWNRLREHLRK